MTKFSRFVLGHKLLVGVLLAVAFLAGGGATALTVARMTEQAHFPGLPAYEANRRIETEYHNGGYQRPFVPVITLAPGGAVVGTAELGRVFAAAAAPLGARVVFAPEFVSADGRTAFALVFPRTSTDGGIPGGLGEVPDESPAISAALAPHLPPGAELRVTGLDTIATGENTGGLNVPVKLVVSAVATLLVLLSLFRSWLAVVPLLIAVVALPVSFIVLAGISFVSEIYETTMMVIPLLGLGIAVNYSLLLVSRWREEQANGYRGDEAVHRAMGTAGRSIVFSSAAVGIGLLALLVLPIPFLQGFGFAGLAVAAVSALVSLTMLPIILSGRDRLAASAQRAAAPSRLWTAWARGVVRHRVVAAVLSGGLLLGLAVIGLTINLALPQSKDMASAGPGHDGLTSLTRAGFPSGVLSSFDALVPPGTSPDAVARAFAALPGVLTATVSPGTSLVTVVPVDETGSAAGRETIHRVRAAAAGVRVGGNATQLEDYLEHTYTVFPWMAALTAFTTFVLLAGAFRSVLLAAKAVLLNLLSLGAVLGAMVVLWQWGWGTEALLGVQPTGSLGVFLPLTLFVFLFGLSTDYEVFIISRMREAYDRTGSTTEAVVEGIGRSARLVTCAALVLFLPFAAMAGGGELDVAVFATGVGLGVLLDATLVRAVLVPATVALLGRWNWWSPQLWRRRGSAGRWRPVRR